MHRISNLDPVPILFIKLRQQLRESFKTEIIGYFFQNSFFAFRLVFIMKKQLTGNLLGYPFSRWMPVPYRSVEEPVYFFVCGAGSGIQLLVRLFP
jgi:hypothetical protein